jgi:hypothetical protein
MNNEQSYKIKYYKIQKMLETTFAGSASILLSNDDKTDIVK